MALANVIMRPVYSLYPDVNRSIRPLFHGYIECLPHIEKKSPEPIYIQWTRDRETMNQTKFQPNHFVPLVDISKMVERTKEKVADPLALQFEDDIPLEVWLELEHLSHQKSGNFDTEHRANDSLLIKMKFAMLM